MNKILISVLLDKYLEVGLLDHCCSIFNFFEEFHIVFLTFASLPAPLHSQQQCTKAQISPSAYSFLFLHDFIYLKAS